MKKQLLLLLTAIISFNGYSQISFEKGYYINNSDQKIDCLIKNLDWKNNPTNFEYKISENSESLNANIESVKEFGIYNNSKYIRKIVKIDKSVEDLGNLSIERNPVFVEEQLFLKVLVEGSTNLYSYESRSLQRFFYNKDNSNIEQLVYKKYLIPNNGTTDNPNNSIGENVLYKQQLYSNLKCPTIEIDKIDQLKYEKNSLINFFIEYNKCNNLEFINYEGLVKKDLFNLTLRIHINNSSLSVQNSSSNNLDTDFGNKLGFGFGVEAEYILPYNKNKWSILIEPTYQSFKSQKTIYSEYVTGGKRISKINYSSIEIPLSLRHYFFINKNSKIFINASFIFDLNLKSTLEFNRADNSNYETFKIGSRNNLGFGAGYKFKDKYSLEMKCQTSREILGGYQSWSSNYNTLSLIFGYSIF